jgi:hypothetical protein
MEASYHYCKDYVFTIVVLSSNDIEIKGDRKADMRYFMLCFVNRMSVLKICCKGRGVEIL